jgi:RHS repeat-associated protein
MVLAFLAALSLAAPAFAHVPARELAPAVDLLHASPIAEEPVQPLRIVPVDLFAEVAHVEAPIPSLSTALAQRFDAQNLEAERPQILHLTHAVRRNLTSGLRESLRVAIIKEINGLGPETRWATGTARARWYDPRTGSWLSPDPLGYQDSSNLYAFAGGDPVNNRDPEGTGVLSDQWENIKSVAGLVVGVGEGAVQTVIGSASGQITQTTDAVVDQYTKASIVIAAYRSGGAKAVVREVKVASNQQQAESTERLMGLPIANTIRQASRIKQAYETGGSFEGGRQVGRTTFSLASDATIAYGFIKGPVEAPGPEPGITETPAPSRVFYGDPQGNLIIGSSELPVNASGGRIILPEGHVVSPLDPPMSEPPIIRRGPFTSQQRAGFLRGNAGGTRIAPHHRGQLPTTYGSVIDELPGPGHPEGNIHTTGSRHPNPSVFNRASGGNAMRQREIRAAFVEKGGRLIEIVPGVWIDVLGR